MANAGTINAKLIKEGILKQEGVDQIYNLWSKNSPGNTVYHVWSLVVLNNFFDKYIYN